MESTSVAGTNLKPVIAKEDWDLEFHGKVDSDWTSFFGGEDIAQRSGRFEDGAELRRARLILTSQAPQRLDFKVSFDFTSSSPDLRDMWLRVNDLPAVGSLRVGQSKEPFGLERSISSNSQIFLERSVAAGLSPNRNVGIAFTRHPLGQQRHLGGGGIPRDGLQRPDDSALQFSEGMQLNQSPSVVDTSSLDANSSTMLSVELAGVIGALLLHAKIGCLRSLAPNWQQEIEDLVCLAEGIQVGTLGPWRLPSIY